MQRELRSVEATICFGIFEDGSSNSFGHFDKISVGSPPIISITLTCPLIILFKNYEYASSFSGLKAGSF